MDRTVSELASGCGARHVGRAVALRTGQTATRIGVLALLGIGLTACGHLSLRSHLPWHHVPPPPEPMVSELVVESAGASAPTLHQSWDRNTLRVDLLGLSGEGDLQLRPLPERGWPIRIEFAVQPGSFAHLEIRGEQRVIFAVAGGGPVTILAVPQGTYAPATQELALHYGP